MKAMIASAAAVASVATIVIWYKGLPQGQKNDVKYVAACLTGIRFDRM